MTTQERLNQLLLMMSEYKEIEAQARYGVEMALKTYEYNHLEKCAKKLVHAQAEMILMSSEAKELQIKLDLERSEI